MIRGLCYADSDGDGPLNSGPAHHVHEFTEQIMTVVRPCGCFRVILHTESRVLPMSNTFNSVVVQVDVRHLNIVRQRLRIQRETMVL